MDSPVYAPRVVRTTHNADGTSIFVPDTHPQTFHPFGPEKSGFIVFDTRNSVPVNNTDAIPGFSNALPRCPPQGSSFCFTEITPGAEVPMHRTLSLDYFVVIYGEVALSLDGGEERTLKTGDVLVQQGVNHTWINRGDKPCRLLGTMLGAEKIVLEDGKVLEETAFKGAKPS